LHRHHYTNASKKPKAEALAPVSRPSKPDKTDPRPAKMKRQRSWLRWKNRLNTIATLLAILTVFFSFFPHLKISEPIAMNPHDLFSYKMDITNDGVLPVFALKFWPELHELKGANGGGLFSGGFFGVVRMENCCTPILLPGESFTVTTERVFSAEAESTASAEFRVVLRYIPILPPIPMRTCVHFHMYRDDSGATHWFKSPASCWF
jgi:hypothetical protein